MAKINVLVVEDESIVSKDIQHSLKKLGYNVVLQRSAFCDYEVIVTGAGNGNTGPTWNSSRQSENSS